ncbi:MAG: PD40 domain-containing protein [Flavobacteriales bacterium]|nr:PD40 domain-containing protein [Flavobacteriales bacterium]
MFHRPLLLFPRLLLTLALCVPASGLRAQFYNGSYQEYGKNRVQYQDFLWQYYRFDQLETYFYKGGRDVARYVALSAHKNKKELEGFFDYTVDERLQFVVYNSLTDFRQSNIGVTTDEAYNIGGVTRIVGTKIFVYNEGEHALLDRQVRSGLAQVMLDRMMYGGNWREVLKNSTLLNLPEWYTKGVVAQATGPMGPTEMSRLRDGVLSGRFDKLNRLTGDDAALAGQSIWAYVADVYGPSVIPNILYMTRVSRNPEGGFLYVLGVGLKTLTEECNAYYKERFTAEDRMKQAAQLEMLPVRTKRTRNYSQFKLSPDGRYAAWVSNEMGQYKLWLYDRTEKKLRRLLKGEKKLNRIVDRSYPVLAWHPTGRALTYALEKRGELYLNTYTVDDRRTVTKPVFLLEKILSMAYSADGQRMVFSGVREGHTDLYQYYVIGNRQEQLTDDLFDDLDPRFVDDGKGIIFSSDRTDDTLRMEKDVTYHLAAKDIFIFDLETRSPILQRMSRTPGFNETQPAQYDSSSYTYLSDKGGLNNRWLVTYDSAVSGIDTTVHYRYFTSEARVTDLKRGIIEQEVNMQRGRYSQLMYVDGAYRFMFGTTTDGRTVQGEDAEHPGPAKRDDLTGGAITDDMSPVVKVAPQYPPDTTADAVDIRDYRFADESAAAGQKEGDVPVIGIADTTSRLAGQGITLIFPEQRNYNVNFATDEVLTQLGNSYNAQFYQPLSGATSLNPGLSGMVSMAASDLFEDHKIIGGFRLALDLNNNDYLLRYANLKRRLNKEFIFQRQSIQGISNVGLVKLHSHSAVARITWPFSELACLRGSLLYRNDRYVVQSTDGVSLRQPNYSDHMTGTRLEYVYDSSIPRGLNLWTGWKLKFFGEYYIQPDNRETDMQVVGMDLRHSLTVHRDIIWVSRLAGSSSFGSRKVLFYMGGVDNWFFPKVDESIPVDQSQNYTYQSSGVPLRGFYYNARNGSSFAMLNTELRIPLFKYLINRPIRSDLIQNFQIIGFGDLGTAWTGTDPYSDDNTFNQQIIERNPLTITIKNLREPILGSYGFGLRTRVLGYFIRGDWAWGVDDGVILDPVFHFSLGLDI